MAEALREDEPIDAPADAAPSPELPDDAPAAPVESDPLSDLLDQYDREVGSRPPSTNGNSSGQLDELEQLLCELGAQQRQHTDLQALNDQLRADLAKGVVETGKYESVISNLHHAATEATNQLNQIKYALWREGELRDFSEFARSVQSKLPSHLPDDYANLWLRNAAQFDSSLAVAWDSRNANPAAVAAELNRVQMLMTGLLANPMADQSKFAELQTYGQKLTIAMNAQQILAAAKGRLIQEARAVKPPLDEDATIDREAITAAVRSAGQKVNGEAAPAWGQLSDRELADYTRRNFGF